MEEINYKSGLADYGVMELILLIRRGEYKEDMGGLKND